MDLKLRGLNALVTGGSRGIGRAIADTLADEGCNIAVCARRADGVESAVAALREKGVRAIGRALDVAQGEVLKRWVSDAAEELGGLDIVVANVSALAIASSEDAWRSGFDIDLMHAVRVVDAAMPHLERSKSGSIVVISSVSGREVDFAAGPYGAFKAALVHYAKGLAFQLAPKGIRANAVSPGNTYFDDGVWQKIERENPEFFQKALALNPTGRMGTPEEMAVAVAFLASPVSSFISGTNLVVDGALTRGVQL